MCGLRAGENDTRAEPTPKALREGLDSYNLGKNAS